MSKKIQFVKMTAQGNNYIYLDNRDFSYSKIDFSQLSKDVSWVRFGIGADGLVVIEHDEEADCLMRIFNNDGSEAQMCGNALRCVGYLLAEEGKTNPIAINTLSGVKIAEVDLVHKSVKVNMGSPRLVKEYKSETLAGNIIDVGNQHLIVNNQKMTYLRDEFLELAESKQRSGDFPDGINIELIYVFTRKHIDAIVYERGSGLTYACGSGATALFWDCYQNKLVDRSVKIKLDGGDVKVSLNSNNNVILEGQVTKICEGTFYWR